MKKSKYLFGIIALCFSLAACSSNGESPFNSGGGLPSNGKTAEPSVKKYSVSIITRGPGTITSNVEEAAVGEVVEFTITPFSNARLEAMVVNDYYRVYPDHPEKITNNKYITTMDEGGLRVAATFVNRSDDTTSSDSPSYPSSSESHLPSSEHYAHVWSQYDYTPPTCTDYGYSYDYCTICGQTRRTTISPTGHSFSEWFQYTSDEYYRYCYNCGMREYSFNPYNQYSSPSQEPSSSTVPYSEHTHYWVEYNYTSPTCTDYGYSYEYCTICGQTRTRTVSPTGHSFTDWMYSSGNLYYRYCTVCGYTENKYQQTHVHEWYVESTVISVDGFEYKEIYCPTCGHSGIMFDAVSGTLASGSSIKSDVPEGFMKLSGNDQSISYIFYLNSSRYCRIYIRAMMDYWGTSASREATYCSNPYGYDPLFSLSVNYSDVDISYMSDVTYEDLLSYGEESGYDNYSPIADCEVGYCQLYNDYNTVTYTRLESYNLTIKSFIFEYLDY